MDVRGEEASSYRAWIDMLEGDQERLRIALERVFPTTRSGFAAWDLTPTEVASGTMQRSYGKAPGYGLLRRRRAPRQTGRDEDYDFFSQTHVQVHGLVARVARSLPANADVDDLRRLLRQLRDDPETHAALNLQPHKELKRHARSALTNLLRLLSNRYRDPDCCKLCGGAVQDRHEHDLCAACGNRGS